MAVITTLAVKAAYRRAEDHQHTAAAAENRHSYHDPQHGIRQNSDTHTSPPHQRSVINRRKQNLHRHTNRNTPTLSRPTNPRGGLSTTVFHWRYTPPCSKYTHITKHSHIGQFQIHTPDTHTHTTPTHPIQYITYTHITHKPLRPKFTNEGQRETPPSTILASTGTQHHHPHNFHAPHTTHHYISAHLSPHTPPHTSPTPPHGTAKTPQVLGGGAQGHGGGNRPGRAAAIRITGAAHLNCKDDGAMAKNSGQGQRSGTAPKKSGGDQEEVERPTGEGASVVSRHHLAVQRTGGGPPPPPLQLTTWEEQVLPILHPEGLAGVGGGMDSGPLPNVTGQEGPHMSTPPTEEAYSDDSSSVQLDLDDQPGPSGTSGQSVPHTQ
ncbi:hypothetical protein NDU88_005028 [Pleurodeles waltl]|uniref:Uncharacterized protein n=1 Tax=Pleurodeles waltl TaxID=8319 RepID=A0AAV7VHV8_PLEWA|nr:hypothetical protein NDU88_005028 [Pleurodeles waltl]